MSTHEPLRAARVKTGRWHLHYRHASAALCGRALPGGHETLPAINVPRSQRCKRCAPWPEHPSHAPRAHQG